MAVISVRNLDHYRALESVSRKWARALDEIHTIVLIKDGQPHPKEEAMFAGFQALEKQLHDLALNEG